MSVRIDTEEIELCFIDHPSNEMSVRKIKISWKHFEKYFQVENILTTYDPQACIVVYSIDDRNSFISACETLQYLSSPGSGYKRPTILVSNKVDLERSRVVSLQG